MLSAGHHGTSNQTTSSSTTTGRVNGGGAALNGCAYGGSVGNEAFEGGKDVAEELRTGSGPGPAAEPRTTAASTVVNGEAAGGHEKAYSYGVPSSAEQYPSTTPHLNPMGLEIRSSPSTGRGVYATTKLASGTIVDISPVLIVPREEYEGEARVGRSVVKDYVFSWGKRGDQALALGLGSLFNHSPNPNLAFRLDVEHQCVVYTLTRSVDPGEELCIFYGHNVRFGPSESPRIEASDNFEDDGLVDGLADFALVDDLALETTNHSLPKSNEAVARVLDASLDGAVPSSTPVEPTLSASSSAVASRPPSTSFLERSKNLLADRSDPVPVKDLPFELITSVVALEDKPLELMNVWVMDIPGPLVHAACIWSREQGLTTEVGHHLKRVKRKGRGDEAVAACMISTNADLSRDDLATMLSSAALLAAHVSPQNPYLEAVPRGSAHTRDQHRLWAQYWPVSYSPIRPGVSSEIRSRDWTTAKLEWTAARLREVCSLARQSHANGELGVACLVAETYDPRIHAFGSAREPITIASASDTRTSSRNPLCHAFTSLIDAVADLDRRGLRRSPLPPPDPDSGRSSPATSSVPYLLTGLTVFASHEPCLLCSMALLHSRIAVLAYAKGVPGAGGCGSVYSVHEQEGLNHRFEVWRWKGSDDREMECGALEVDA